MKRRILCVPETRPGHGTGHIKRCLELIASIGDTNSGVLLLHSDTKAVQLVPEHLRIQQPQGTYDLVVIDTRDVSRRLVRYYARFGLVVGIDAKGTGRRYCDYLIDILPHIHTSVPPNVCEPGFLTQPENVRVTPPQDFSRILLVFGGEDALGLSSKVAAKLVSIGVAPERISALIGSAFWEQTYPDGVQLIRNMQNAREHFAEYDLVITPFSLSLFEAAAAGCAVVGFHPSRYHQKLADMAGFHTIGVRHIRQKRLKALFDNPEHYVSALTQKTVHEPQSLATHLLQLRPLQTIGSPVAGERCNPGILRTAKETFFRCRKTRLVYKQRYFPLTVQYNQDYFSNEYRKQYGRSYLEDYEKIRQMGTDRLQIINKLLPEQGSLLDLGCAYGPFLQAAQDDGWQPYGIDISAAAVEWVRNNLNIPVYTGDVLTSDPIALFNTPGFSVVSLWYVIEHIAELGELLRKINLLLQPNGVCALATPNGSGISAKKSFHRFLLDGPPDHLTIFEPRYMQRLFGSFGFHVEKIRITGHHPERFPLLGKTGVGRRCAAMLSRSLGLGDTFELYVRKVGAPLL